MMLHPNQRVSACGAKAVANARCLFGRRRLPHSVPGWLFAALVHALGSLLMPAACPSVDGASLMFSGVTLKPPIENARHYIANKYRRTCFAIPARWSCYKQPRTSGKSLFGWDTAV